MHFIVSLYADANLARRIELWQKDGLIYGLHSTASVRRFIDSFIFADHSLFNSMHWAHNCDSILS